MDKKQRTVESYNKSAISIAKKFDNLSVRVENINEIFSLFNKLDLSVLEIGCGNGRDAQEIVKHTNNYRGLDISEELIKLARIKVPQTRFEIADVEQYDFPKNLDVVIAFASLLHVDKENFRVILEKIFASLNSGGVVYLSLKYSDVYKEVEQKDEFGVRTFYLYSKQDIREAAKGFRFLKEEVQELRGQKWLEVILQKA